MYHLASSIIAMHELSIAQSIVEIVHQYIPNDERQVVKTVKVKVGELAGVVPESLDFCFKAIVDGTPLQDACLQIDHVPFTLKCTTCTGTFRNEPGIMLCPNCGGSNTSVMTGTELQVVEIELQDEPAEVP